MRVHSTAAIASAALLVSAVMIAQSAIADPEIERKGFRPTIELRGRIDYPLAKALNIEKGSLVIIDSGGGKGGAIIALANKLIASDSTLLLPKRCFSGCAEILLPAPIPKSVGPETLFALHFNSQIMDHLEAEYFPDHPIRCNEHEAKALEDFRRDLGLDIEFWRKQLAQLNFHSISRLPDEDCAFALEIANAWWVPDAEEIRHGFGVEFDQLICNDSFECIERSAVLLLKPGQRLVWRGSVYQLFKSGVLAHVQ